MSFRLGLTGSIGMGKSTTAKLFVEAGCAVWDADAAVHRLYARGGAAVAPMQAIFPEVIIDGAVSRLALKAILSEHPGALTQIERIVHPLVAQDRAQFLRSSEADIAVLDIPLLYETRGEKHMNGVAVVTAPPDIQRSRVMGRGTMTEAQFEAILAKQMPDAEKRARADYIITTDTVEHARTQVQDIVAAIRRRLHA